MDLIKYVILSVLSNIKNDDKCHKTVNDYKRCGNCFHCLILINFIYIII